MSKKWEFGRDRVGHAIDRGSISSYNPDASTYQCDRHVERKFSARFSGLSQHLRELSTKRSWTWGNGQEQAFVQIKAELSQPTVLVFYNPKAPTKISADASGYELFLAYASRSMTKRNAQIEALAVTWSCDKLSCYILGRHFDIETDHKPLDPLLSTKNLDNLTPRVLRFLHGMTTASSFCTSQTLYQELLVGVNSLLL